MANKRIKDISTTATSPNADDVCVIDGATAGTRKIAAKPLSGNFDVNIVVENGGNKTTYASNFLRSENGAYYIDAYNVGGDIIFRTSVASALDTQSMVIDGATGNIGIGSTGGGNKLTVVSAEATTPQVLIQNSTSTGDAALSFNVSGRTFTMGIDKSDSEKFKISRSSELGNTDYLTIDGGNVGIGGAPSSSLHVYSSTADNLRLERDATNDWRIQLTSGALAFRDATADAERLRLDSSGNVKAGTGTFPVAALAGIQIANGASSYSYFSATDDTKQFAAGIDHTLSEGVVGMISNHGLRVVTNNTERLRVDASGNLAIGTTSSSYPLTIAKAGDNVKLDVTNTVNANFRIGTSGSAAQIGPSTSSNLELQTGGITRAIIDTGGNLILQKGGGAYLQLKDASAVRGAINVGTSDGLIFTTGASFDERLRIDSSGRVGQSGITPGSYHANADNLVLANDGLSGESGLTIRSGTSDGGSIYFADGTTGDQRYRGYISYSHSSDALQFGSAGAESMRIVGGNLAIGLSDPNGYKLNVNGTAFFNGAITAADLNVSGATPVITVNDTDGDANGATPYVQFQQGGTGIGKIGDLASGRSAMMLYADTGKELMFFTNGQNATSDTPRCTIDSSGNVTVKGGRLEAKPTSGTNTGSQSELRLYGHESNASRFAAIKCFNTGGTDQNALSFYTSSGGTETQRVRIDEVAGDVEVLTGNVVIGTSDKGIDFGSGASTTLSDYERGFHNATLTPSASGTITANTSGDRLEYTRVGDLVTITGKVGLVAASSPVGNYVKLSLPLTIASLTEAAGHFAGSCLIFGAAGNSGDYTIIGVDGESFARIYKNTDPLAVATAADFSGNESVYVSFSYHTS